MLNFYLSLTNRNMATRRNVTGSVNTTGRLPLQYPPKSEFNNLLTSSLIPQQSVGAITYSRATIATVTDHEWLLHVCKSGEARFQWARRVENLFSYSEDASNVYWNKVRASVTSNAIAWPSGNLIADLVVGTVAGTSYIYAPMSVIAGNKYRVSVSVKAADVTNFNITSFTQAGSGVFDLALGTAWTPAGIGSSPTMTNLWNGWYKCSILFTANATGSNNIGFVSQSYVWNICYVCEMQMEDVTGQSDTSFGGYVSTNVLSSPFHGAMVDGVKYFDTDINGNTISENTLKGFLCEWARTNLFVDSEDFSLWTLWGTWVITPNATIAPDGRMTADLFTLSTANEWQSVNKTITTTASIYGYSVYVKPNGHNYVQLLASSGINPGYVNFDLLNWVVGTASGYTGSIESLPNGWYRIKAITPTVTAATGAFIIAAVPSANAPRGSFVSGTGTSWVYLWWSQLEIWPNVSSYIPTTTVAVTRNIDAFSCSGLNSIANKGAFSAVFHMNDSELFDRRAISLSASNNNRLQLPLRRSGVQNVSLYYWDNTSVVTLNTTQSAWTNNVVVSWINWVWVNIFMNNTKYSSGIAPNLIFTSVDIGGWLVTIPLFWCIKNVRIWKTPPTDTELLFLSNNP